MPESARGRHLLLMFLGLGVQVVIGLGIWEFLDLPAWTLTFVAMYGLGGILVVTRDSGHGRVADGFSNGVAWLVETAIGILIVGLVAVVGWSIWQVVG